MLYCLGMYVSVNTLCREFLWPGIDLSECLQYPDFSCVVLFRYVCFIKHTVYGVLLARD